MVGLDALMAPVLVSAVFVFIASAIIWMAMPHHKSDWKQIPSEEEIRRSIKKDNLPPGQYLIPYAKDQKEMQSPEIQKKMEEGPLAFVTLGRPGKPDMRKNMLYSFAYYLVVSFFVAYISSRMLAAGTRYLAVFRLCGTLAILAYGGALPPLAIWFHRPWSVVAKELLDAVVFGLLTAGTFGWLWPE